MYCDDVGIDNIAHIHPPAPHLTFKPTLHNHSLRWATRLGVVAVVTVTAAAVGGDDNSGNSDGWGHRQQSTKIGSKDTVAVATAIFRRRQRQQRQ